MIRRSKKPLKLIVLKAFYTFDIEYYTKRSPTNIIHPLTIINATLSTTVKTLLKADVQLCIP